MTAYLPLEVTTASPDCGKEPGSEQHSRPSTGTTAANKPRSRMPRLRKNTPHVGRPNAGCNTAETPADMRNTSRCKVCKVWD
jgi:hypothetical protein